jgi:hypothetical protein
LASVAVWLDSKVGRLDMPTVYIGWARQTRD